MMRRIWISLVVWGALSASLLGAEKNVSSSARVEAAFGAECEVKLIEALQGARSSISVAIFSFARKRIAQALLHAKGRGVKVRVKVDAEQAKFEYTEELLAKMKKAGIPVTYITMPEGKHMHHKFAVVDKRRVVTGSFNWTRSATEENWENVVVIESKKIAKCYAAEWEAIGAKK